jgi:hypothetical protein
MDPTVPRANNSAEESAENWHWANTGDGPTYSEYVQDVIDRIVIQHPGRELDITRAVCTLALALQTGA